MSQPARPTRVKRKAVFASGVARRRSDAIVMMAPAPTATPSMAAMIGLPQPSIALTRSPVMRVKASSPFMSMPMSGPMMSCTSPPEQKLPAVGQEGHDRDVLGDGEVAEGVAQLGVGVEGQR